MGRLRVHFASFMFVKLQGTYVARSCCQAQVDIHPGRQQDRKSVMVCSMDLPQACMP